MRTLLIGLTVLTVLAVAGIALTWRPAIGRAPRPQAFDQHRIARGKRLAQIGDCIVCHTAKDGRSYAGGLPIRTPFGTVYSSNITPDETTGIGAWPLSAFRRALREGVSRNGARLYPAFPYDHFRGLTDGDVGDLYAFLMSRTPVVARPPGNRLVPPLGFRPLLAAWQFLFLQPPPSPPVAAAPDDEQGRGRYLAEALAHCGACHSPRNALGAEQSDRAYSGGWSDGWYAPPLDGSSPAVRAWSVERLTVYLTTGLDLDHAAAAGPMGPVTQQLAQAPEADAHAIAVYIASKMRSAEGAHDNRSAPDTAALAARSHPAAAVLFTGACATCHEAGAPMMSEGRPPLQLGTPLQESTPRDTLTVILKGVPPPLGRSGPFMPAFEGVLTDAQTAELAAYLRARFTDRPPWPGDLAKDAARARKEAS